MHNYTFLTKTMSKDYDRQEYGRQEYARVRKMNTTEEMNDFIKLGIDSWGKLQAYERELKRKEEVDEWLKLGIDSWSKLQAYERKRRAEN